MSVVATPTLRERQAPLKTRYEADADSVKLTLVVRSATAGDAPTRVQIATADAAEGAEPTGWDVGAHPMAAGDGDLACSGDLLLASLAACQEITLRMVAAAMGIPLRGVEVTVEGDMDFRGTMGLDPEVPVGLTAIRTDIRVVADAPPDRLERLARRAERYCVVAATLREAPALATTIRTEPAAGA
jgi:uncharacterized OsmC-like protein